MKILKILLLLLLSIGIVAGCKGVSSAYKAAGGAPDKEAYVVAEHYAALVHEAADLKEKGLDARLVAKLQAADDVARPLIFKLKTLTDAYKNVKSAANEEALARAVSDAAVAVSSFIDALKEAKR